MSNIKKILVALAFSPYAEGIFNYAVNVAEHFNAELIVGSVINERDVSAVMTISSLGYDVDGDHYVESIKEERNKMLESYLKASSFDRNRISIVIKVGSPIDELLKLIVKKNVDMVVMGIKGRTNLEHVFVGSVADKLFHRSPVPVLSYRDKENAERLRKKIHLT